MKSISTPTSLDEKATAMLSPRLLRFSAMLFALGILALSVDLPISYLFVSKNFGPIWHECRDGLRKLVQPGEAFANGWVIALLLLAFYAVDTARRRYLFRGGMLLLTTGVVALVGKCVFARSRPKAFFDYDQNAFSGGVLSSFDDWLPLASLGYSGQSLPSGHTATAVALGIILCLRWPHARWVFFTFVGLAVAQRITHGHHYLSDCFLGASLACFLAFVYYHPHLLGRFFDRFEQTLAPSVTYEEQDAEPASDQSRRRRAA